MRTSPLTRWLALFMGVWLSLVQSDAGLFHACATGNAAVAAQVATDGAPGAHAAHEGDGATVSHASHTPHHAATPAQAATAPEHPAHQHPTGDGECHCVGHCCPVSVPALAATDAFVVSAMVRITTTQPGRAAHAVVAQWADYVLPFATAPPVIVEA